MVDKAAHVAALRLDNESPDVIRASMSPEQLEKIGTYLRTRPAAPDTWTEAGDAFEAYLRDMDTADLPWHKSAVHGVARNSRERNFSSILTTTVLACSDARRAKFAFSPIALSDAVRAPYHAAWPEIRRDTRVPLARMNEAVVLTLEHVMWRDKNNGGYAGTLVACMIGSREDTNTSASFVTFTAVDMGPDAPHSTGLAIFSCAAARMDPKLHRAYEEVKQRTRGQVADVVGQAVDAAGQAVDAAGQAVDAAGQAAEAAGQAAEAAGQAVDAAVLVDTLEIKSMLFPPGLGYCEQVRECIRNILCSNM
jgi:hypothetical protein